MAQVKADYVRVGMPAPVVEVSGNALRGLTCLQLLACFDDGVAVSERVVLGVNIVDGEILEFLGYILLCENGI